MDTNIPQYALQIPHMDWFIYKHTQIACKTHAKIPPRFILVCTFELNNINYTDPNTHSETHNGPVYIQTLFYLYLHMQRHKWAPDHGSLTLWTVLCTYAHYMHAHTHTRPLDTRTAWVHICTYMPLMDWFIYKHAHICTTCNLGAKWHSAKRQKVPNCTISHRCGTLNMHTNMPKSTFDMVPPVEICTKCTICT